MPGPRARWLADMYAAGKIPDPPELSEEQRSQIGLRLSIDQSANAAPKRTCASSTSLEYLLEHGDVVSIRADEPGARIWPGSVIRVEQLGPYGGTRATATYFTGNGFRYEVLSDKLKVRISAPGARSVRVCKG